MTSLPSPSTYGLCSDVAGAAGQAVLDLWDHLERRHGLREARAALRPHVSYLVGETDRPAAAAIAVAAIAPRLQPVTVRLGGLAVFDGPAPVLYLAVEREPLADLHARLFAATAPLWTRLWPHYGLAAWTPHVTLALRDLPRERLEDVLADLRTRPLPSSARLEHVDLVHVVLPHHAYLSRHRLGPAPAPPAG